MEILNFSTVYMAILTSTLLLIILSVIFCHKKILLNAGYKLLAVFLILIAVRLFLPFEFPFATTIPLPEGISKVIIAFFKHRFFTETRPISIYHLFILTWIVGVLFKSYRFIRTNQMIKSYILAFGKNVTKTSPYAAALTDLCATDTCVLRIYEVPEITAPFLYGIKTPFILIPADQDYDQKTLTYIIRHEAAHYTHHDLWLKLGVQLLTIIYWWNPFSYLLRKQINLVIEMRIDDTIVDENDKVQDYLQSLIHVAENRNSILNHKLGNVISFLPKSETELTRRFVMLAERNYQKKKGINIFLLCLISTIFILSYLIILEADYVVYDIEATSFNTGQVNSFAVDNTDGTYDIYILDIYIDTVTSFEYYGDDMPILTKEAFERVQQENAKQD